MTRSGIMGWLSNAPFALTARPDRAFSIDEGENHGGGPIGPFPLTKEKTMEAALKDHINALAAILDDQAAQLQEIENENDIYHRMQLLSDFQRGGRIKCGPAGVGRPGTLRGAGHLPG